MNLLLNLNEISSVETTKHVFLLSKLHSHIPVANADAFRRVNIRVCLWFPNNLINGLKLKGKNMKYIDMIDWTLFVLCYFHYMNLLFIYIFFSTVVVYCLLIYLLLIYVRLDMANDLLGIELDLVYFRKQVELQN